MEKIEIALKGYDTDEVLKEIQNSLKDTDATASIKPIKFGGILADPVIIAVGSQILVALIKGLFHYLSIRKPGKIIISGKDGGSLEVPSNTPKEDILTYAETAKKMAANKIVLTAD